MPTLSPTDLSLLRTGVQVPLDVAVWSVEGPAAVACLQGIVTADVERAGPGSVRYGGFLTPKGMLISDAWILRAADGFRVVAPAAARDALGALFPRMMPPRLARAAATGESVRAVLGADDGALLRALGAPAPGSTEVRDGTWLARPREGAPFGLLRLGAPGAEPLAGLPEAGPELADAWRVLRGWPALDAEIGDKTLPQEVRFDEHDGVSYEKGCYTGQETVARLHFRGHANRMLRGIRAAATPGQGVSELLQDGKVVGRVTSAVELPDGWAGLAVVRREVETGAEVQLGDTTARVVDLPHPEALA